MSGLSRKIPLSWAKKTGALAKKRPAASRFTFFVCSTIVIALGAGFLGGFVVASFALSDNYGAVYEGLLSELESSKNCLERKKNVWNYLADDINKNQQVITSAYSEGQTPGTQLTEQAVFDMFENSIEMLRDNDVKSACYELRNIIYSAGYGSAWRDKALYLINFNCRHYESGKH